MRMKRLSWVLLVMAATIVVAFASACGASDSGASLSHPEGSFDTSEESNQVAIMAEPTAVWLMTRDGEAMEEEIAAFDYSMDTDSTSAGDSAEKAEVTVQLASFAQNRIIVHTGRMSLVVNDVANALSQITDVSTDLGGWVVGSNRVSQHSGSIAIRVPAGSLQDAFNMIEALALEVASREITSQDVTDEYVDIESRLVSLRATRDRLLSFLEQSGTIEDALLVEKELSALEERIEGMQGRINYLSQTLAFSLIEVNLQVSPVQIEVDPGPDASLRVGENGRFRASFRAPPGIEEFSFVWDFGDGTSAAGAGSTLRPDGTRLTATVTHTYEDDRDSPYIVRVDLTGAGEEGLAEGSASMEATVREVPTIDVFAGENQTVEEGDEVDYVARFTRPAELRDFEYQWEFGDGSPTVTGSIEDGESRIAVSHEYSDFRPRAYEVVVTVSAMSDVGRVSSSDSFTVHVTEVEGFAVGGWDVGETAKTAVRALSAVGKVALAILIWVGIFSPVILVIGAAVILIRRYGSRLRSAMPGGPSPSGSNPGGEAE